MNFMVTPTSRTFELSMLLPWQKRKWIAFIIAAFFALLVFLALAAIAIHLFSHGDAEVDAVDAVFQILFFLYFLTSAGLQARHLRSQFLRIGDGGISWRMLEGLAGDRMLRPPYSVADLAWGELRSVREEASGIRFRLTDEREAFLPLSQLVYAQRQEIKRVLHLHLDEHEIPNRPFVPEHADTAAPHADVASAT